MFQICADTERLEDEVQCLRMSSNTIGLDLEVNRTNTYKIWDQPPGVEPPRVEEFTSPSGDK